MKKLFRLLFPKYEVRHLSFQTGTDGMKRHKKFIEDVNIENAEIINSYITYYRDFKNNHLPEYINYVVKVKK
jgi:hypothetical protein